MESLYLTLFPENIESFNKCLYDYNSVVNTLYELYYDIKVRKIQTIDNVDRLMKINLNNIHSYYIQNLRDKNKFITKKNIDTYLTGLKNNIIVKLIGQNLPREE